MMIEWRKCFNAVFMAGFMAGSGNAVASDGGQRIYQVTITNITKGEIFTPVMVASHGRGLRIFDLGTPATPELEMLAEGGDTGPLAESLLSAGALDVATAGGVLPPGQSVTLKVATNRKNRHVSLASMLVPSNDAFVALNGMAGPRGRGTLTRVAPAYDAGSEHNDELCVNIPGPPFVCAGEGYNPAGGEGYVYIHPGIHGVGDLAPAAHDWRNPVAKITIRALRDVASD